MPELSTEDNAKLVALEEMLRAGEKIRFTEVVAVYWPEPDGTVYYCHTQIDEVPGFRDLPLSPVRAKLITPSKSPFREIPKTAAVSDDTVGCNLSDLDGEISRLCYLHGAGVRARLFAYYPDVGLTLRSFTGTLRAPKEANGRTLKVDISSGFRSAKLVIPRRLPAPGCMFIFGGHLSSQEEIDLHNGCPFNLHLGGPIGLVDPATGLPWADCARDSEATCVAHLGTRVYFPGFKTKIEAVFNGQTRGPNLYALTRGNDASLTDPIRSVYGTRFLKALRVLAYAPENNNNHPEQGFVKGLFEGPNGPIRRLHLFQINGVWVGAEHRNFRTGEIGQPPTAFSPNVGTYSGTAVAMGRIQGDFRNVGHGDLSATLWADGYDDVRVYSDPGTYVRQWTRNRAWCLLDMHARPREMYGEDYERYDVESVIDAAGWCDEEVAMTDPNGNVFAGTRSTFDAELSGRATQTQIEDVCTAGHMGLPYEYNGKKHFAPLRRETIDDSIPFFTDYGPDANICAGEGGHPLVTWSYTGDDELVNQYTVTFDDGMNGCEPTPLIFGDERQQLAAGRAWGDRSIRVINKNVPAFGVTNMSEAARLGNLLLYLGPRDTGGIRNNFKVKLTTWHSQALRVRMYKLVRLRIRGLTRLFESLGIPGFEYFRVMRHDRKGDLQVELEVQAYPVDFYEQMESVVTAPPIPPQPVTTNPGGWRDKRPEPIGFQVLDHNSDTIEVTFQQSSIELL